MSGLSLDACASFYCHPASGPSPSDASPIRYPDEPSLDDGHGPGKALASRLGLDDRDLFGSQVCCDAFLFSPCGFSANMVSKDASSVGGGGGRYATVHVTPEQGWSYASFECNIDFSGVRDDKTPSGEGQEAKRADLKALVGRVVGMFGPKRFSLTLFVSREEGMREEHEDGRPDEPDAPDGQDEGKEGEAADVEEAIHEGFRTVLSRDLVKGYRRTDRIVYEFDGCAPSHSRLAQTRAHGSQGTTSSSRRLTGAGRSDRPQGVDQSQCSKSNVASRARPNVHERVAEVRSEVVGVLDGRKAVRSASAADMVAERADALSTSFVL